MNTALTVAACMVMMATTITLGCMSAEEESLDAPGARIALSWRHPPDEPECDGVVYTEVYLERGDGTKDVTRINECLRAHLGWTSPPLAPGNYTAAVKFFNANAELRGVIKAITLTLSGVPIAVEMGELELLGGA